LGACRAKATKWSPVCEINQDRINTESTADMTLTQQQVPPNGRSSNVAFSPGYTPRLWEERKVHIYVQLGKCSSTWVKVGNTLDLATGSRHETNKVTEGQVGSPKR